MKRQQLSYSRLALKYFRSKSLSGLKNRNFSIISNNCTAGFIYKDAGVEYLSPTIGLFFYAPCYLALLTNFEMIHAPLHFITTSKYISANKWRSLNDNFYPIAQLNGQIEIHFLHYKSNEEARDKWERRLSRLNTSNILFIFSARDNATDRHIKQFLSLPFANKLCFSAIDYGNIKDLVYFKQYRSAGEMPPADEARINVLRKIRFGTLLNDLKPRLYSAASELMNH